VHRLGQSAIDSAPGDGWILATLRWSKIWTLNARRTEICGNLRLEVGEGQDEIIHGLKISKGRAIAAREGVGKAQAAIDETRQVLERISIH
jgi:hypothetical protein